MLLHSLRHHLAVAITEEPVAGLRMPDERMPMDTHLLA